MDAGDWWAAAHGVAKSWTRLSNFTFTFHFHALEQEVATHSSVLAWRIPGTGEPGGLPSMGSHRVGHDWSDLAAAARTQKGFPDGSDVNNLPAMRETWVWSLGWIRSLGWEDPWRREWHTQLQYSGLENSMDRTERLSYIIYKDIKERDPAGNSLVFKNGSFKFIHFKQ